MIARISIVFLLPLLIVGCTSLGTQPATNNPFLAQKGSLSWPAEGEISEPFGTRVNEVYGTKVHNPGILIATTPSADVTSVFEGEVEAVYTMPEFGRVITINHGAYVSLYGNMSDIQVESGMAVEQGQLIGTAGTDDEPKGASVFFALFEDGKEADPEMWLGTDGTVKKVQKVQESRGALRW